MTRWVCERFVHRNYEDGSDSWDHVFDFDNDVDVLRDRVNTYLSQHPLGRFKRIQQISKDTNKSNEWYSDGGGCGHTEWYAIRPWKELEIKYEN